MEINFWYINTLGGAATVRGCCVMWAQAIGVQTKKANDCDFAI